MLTQEQGGWVVLGSEEQADGTYRTEVVSEGWATEEEAQADIERLVEAAPELLYEVVPADAADSYVS